MKRIFFLFLLSFPAVAQTQQSKIYGTWQNSQFGYQMTLILNQDGTGELDGEPIKFVNQPGSLSVTAEGVTIKYSYVLLNNSLTISGGDFEGKVVFSRSGASDEATGNTAAASTGAAKGKDVPQELVGQWCYLNMNTNSQTSRCITLNGDGSYYYSYEGSRSVNTETLSGGTASQNSDRGTWYVQGDRIYYNSQSSGQGSYRLEKRNHPKNLNDPMIVLDGEAYVTMTSRVPWR